MNDTKISKMGKAILERKLIENTYTEISDIPEFPLTTLIELKKMYLENKISFIFLFNKEFESLSVEKNKIKLVNLLITLTWTLFLIFTIYFIYQSFNTKNFIFLIGIPFQILALTLSNPNMGYNPISLIIFTVCLIMGFYIESESWKLILIFSGLLNVIMYLIRKIYNTLMTNLILENEILFVKGYIKRLFSIKNNKNKVILHYLELDALHNSLASAFEQGLP